MTGDQELGYVEKKGPAWAWRTRMIPGPLGAFEGGNAASEFEARKQVEARWVAFTENP